MSLRRNIRESVTRADVRQPGRSNQFSYTQDLVMHYVGAGAEIQPWGYFPRQRDVQLRKFWPTENVFASALGGMLQRYAAFQWSLSGPLRVANAYEYMLHTADNGQGWEPFIQKFLVDVCTQDNGGFMELIRAQDSENSPVIGLGNLDSNKCERTGNPMQPVIYWDDEMKPHKMKWYQIIEMTDMPSPIREAKGTGYCALTRIFTAAQIMRDIAIYKHEKISGRRQRAIHFVGGVQRNTVKDALAQHEAETDAQGMIRYIQPLVVAGLDPTARVSVATIELAALPDGFDEDVALRWYINLLALALGQEYQDFAPLPGGNLGSGAQSEVLHEKGRGKGPAFFMKSLEHKFKYFGVLPRNVTFAFGQQDVAEDMDEATLRKRRAEERSLRIASKEITPKMSRAIAVQQGDLSEEVNAMFDEKDYVEQTPPSGMRDINGQGSVGREESDQRTLSSEKAYEIATKAARDWSALHPTPVMRDAPPPPPQVINVTTPPVQVDAVMNVVAAGQNQLVRKTEFMFDKAGKIIGKQEVEEVVNANHGK